jgi:hypothetical protein
MYKIVEISLATLKHPPPMALEMHHVWFVD